MHWCNLGLSVPVLMRSLTRTCEVSKLSVSNRAQSRQSDAQDEDCIVPAGPVAENTRQGLAKCTGFPPFSPRRPAQGVIGSPLIIWMVKGTSSAATTTRVRVPSMKSRARAFCSARTRGAARSRRPGLPRTQSRAHEAMVLVGAGERCVWSRHRDAANQHCSWNYATVTPVHWHLGWVGVIHRAPRIETFGKQMFRCFAQVTRLGDGVLHRKPDFWAAVPSINRLGPIG